MKPVIFIATLFLLFVSSCGNEPASTDPKPVVVETPQKSKPSKKSPKYQLTPSTHLYDVGQEHLFTVLAREYWVYEHYIDKGVPQNKEHTGDWFHFNPDGTYTSGRWEEETGSGIWKIYYRDGRNYLNINSTDNDQDVEFDVQFNSEDTAASWVGTSMYPLHAQVMLKAIPLSSMPTKKQFHFKY